MAAVVPTTQLSSITSNALDSFDTMLYIATGTGTTAPAVGDTALDTETLRKSLDVSAIKSLGAGTYRFQMRIAFRNPKTYIVMAVDALLLYISYVLAYWLRFESFSGAYLDFFYESVFYIIALKLTVFYFFGLQSGMWRYTGIYDLINLIKALFHQFPLIF